MTVSSAPTPLDIAGRRRPPAHTRGDCRGLGRTNHKPFVTSPSEIASSSIGDPWRIGSASASGVPEDFAATPVSEAIVTPQRTIMSRALGACVVAALAAACAANPAEGGANSVLAPGGSNFSWYQVDRPQPSICIREPYGVISNFNNAIAHAQIEDELAQMIASGQRRLRIGIFHGRGFNTGTVMDSTGGDLSAQNRRNLGDLLAAVKAAGFVQVEVAFHPEGPAIREWTRWDESRFEENWNLIRNLRPIIRASGLSYRLDLSNEAIPGPGDPLVLEYSRRLWANYTRAFGRADTVGLSVIGDPQHVARIPEVYGDKPPDIFDVHFYGGTNRLDEYQLFRAADGTMKRLGLNQPWIIGEAFYDDAIAAAQLRAAIAETTRPVYYLTQWPLTRGSTCADVDIPAPTAFDAYRAAGFALPGSFGPAMPMVASRKLRVDMSGQVEVAVGCARAAAPCSGTLTLRVRARTLGTRGFALLPPRTAIRRFRLSASLRKVLRRRGSLPASVSVTVRSEDSDEVVRRALAVVLVGLQKSARRSTRCREATTSGASPPPRLVRRFDGGALDRFDSSRDR
jgi:hypothetical protein